MTGGYSMRSIDKKVLLIKPNYYYFPVGFSYVVAALERYGIEYDFIDTYLTPKPDIAGYLRKGSYLAVATGGLLGNYTFYKSLFLSVKEADPAMPCILGGNVTSDVDKNLLMEQMPIDYLVVGEGDITFPELLLHIAGKGTGDIESVHGIYYRAGDEIRKTDRRARLDLLERNYMPSWDFFDHKAYGDRAHARPVLTGRGCVGHCSFCSPTNGRFITRSVEQIVEEVEFLNSRYDFSMFVFINEIFFQDPEDIIKFCREYKKITPHKIWHCLMRMDVDAEVLREMRDAGCRLMNVGVESGSDRVLASILKETTVEQMRRFSRMSREVGISLQASFMMANYTETEEDIVKTVDFLIEEHIGGPMALTINYPGTANYRWALKKGMIDDPVKYIESLDLLYSRNYIQVISGHLGGTLSYLNLSAMPTERLFKVVEREMRRYNTQNFAIKNQRIEIAGDAIDLSGECSFCGHPLQAKTKRSAWNLFDLKVSCIKCGAAENYFHPDILPGLKPINEEHRGLISKAKRIALAGMPQEIDLILMLDLFGINYDTIVGVFGSEIDPPGTFHITHPTLAADDILALQPDLVVLTGSVPVSLIDEFRKFQFARFVDLRCRGARDGILHYIFQRHGLDSKSYQFLADALGDPVTSILDEIARFRFLADTPMRGLAETEAIGRLHRVIEEHIGECVLAGVDVFDSDLKAGVMTYPSGFYKEIPEWSARLLGPDDRMTVLVPLRSSGGIVVLLDIVFSDPQDLLQNLGVTVNGIPAVAQLRQAGDHVQLVAFSDAPALADFPYKVDIVLNNPSQLGIPGRRMAFSRLRCVPCSVSSQARGMVVEMAPQHSVLLSQ